MSASAQGATASASAETSAAVWGSRIMGVHHRRGQKESSIENSVTTMGVIVRAKSMARAVRASVARHSISAGMRSSSRALNVNASQASAPGTAS